LTLVELVCGGVKSMAFMAASNLSLASQTMQLSSSGENREHETSGVHLHGYVHVDSRAGTGFPLQSSHLVSFARQPIILLP
jgi:hypothetical protein